MRLVYHIVFQSWKTPSPRLLSQCDTDPLALSEHFAPPKKTLSGTHKVWCQTPPLSHEPVGCMSLRDVRFAAQTVQPPVRGCATFLRPTGECPVPERRRRDWYGAERSSMIASYGILVCVRPPQR